LKKYFFLQNLDISEKNIINVKAAKVIYGSELSLSLSLSLSPSLSLSFYSKREEGVGL